MTLLMEAGENLSGMKEHEREMITIFSYILFGIVL